MDQLPRLGKRELICLLLFTCNYVVFVWRGFLFLWMLEMGYVILSWHSLCLKGSPNGLFHVWYIWSDLWQKSGKILKNGFRSLGRGVKNEAFPFKILTFKIFIYIVFQNHHFCQIFKKLCFIILLMSGLCAINGI